MSDSDASRTRRHRNRRRKKQESDKDDSGVDVDYIHERKKKKNSHEEDDASLEAQQPDSFNQHALKKERNSLSLVLAELKGQSGDAKLQSEIISLEFPESADGDFIKKIFGNHSTYPKHLQKDTGCTVKLVYGDVSLDFDGGGRISRVEVTGDVKSSSLREATRRVKGLFKTNNAMKPGMLMQFVEGGGRSGLDLEDLSASSETRTFQKPTKVSVPKKITNHLMTPGCKQLLQEASGADVDWDALTAQALLLGSAEQISAAKKLLGRIASHCAWGSSEPKIQRIIRPKKVESMIIRLSPMGHYPSLEKRLTTTVTQLSIGKAKDGNDLCVHDSMASRQHCLFEFDVARGAVYVIDLSTNGAWLNGHKLPSKSSGKVILCHGDELLLRDPSHHENEECGWVVNITEVAAETEKPMMNLTRKSVNYKIGSGTFIGNDFYKP